MDISLSYNCNFQCEHCSAKGFQQNEKKSLTRDEYLDIANQAMKLGCLIFHFTGGEPLLRNDLFEIIKVFQPKKNIISIQTNGWNVNPRFLEEFYEIGGDILCVSVDSSIASKHDKFRNAPGSWERSIAALESAKHIGIRIIMSTIITHDNIQSDEMRQLISLSKSLGAILSLNLAVASGAWKGQTQNLLTTEDRLYLNKLMRKFHHLRTDFEFNWKIRGCPAFKEKCYLTPYGDVMPCPSIPITFGNIRKNSLAKIREKALGYEILRKYHSICLASENKSFVNCAGCYSNSTEKLPLSYMESPIFKIQNDNS